MAYHFKDQSTDNTYGITISGHFYKEDTYQTIRPQGMSEWLIVYTIRGEGYFITSTQKVTCQRGDVILLKPGRPHEYGTSKGKVWNFVWAHFSEDSVEKYLLTNEDINYYHIESYFTRKRIFEAFRRIIVDSREQGDFWQELCLNALGEILMILAKSNSQKLDARVKEALHLLSIHMGDPIRVEGLAKRVGLSPSRLSHLFKSSTGQTIVEALNQMRIQQAALLLKHTNRNAMEVSLDVGFNNYNHFINQFRKYYGTNPSTYKKRRSNPTGKSTP